MTESQAQKRAEERFDKDFEHCFKSSDQSDVDYYKDIYKQGYLTAYEDLDPKIEKLVEALSFYADERNWCEQEGIGTLLCDTINFDDIEEIKVADSKHFDIGGKKAREALKQWKEGE